MSKKFIFPAEVLGNHIAALGKTGSGKTSTAKGIVETVVPKGARVCILDTIKSDWWGLTSSADGKKPGLPFKILGGPRGHVPLHSNAGKAIGELVGSGKLPLSIIDMADFEPGGLQRFFVDFSQSLWRSMRGVIYLVIEEAHELAPKERAGFGAENLSIHWAKKLATGSRTKGIRLIVCTQRVQALHNAVLGSCETVIAHRLTLDADQRPVIDWLKNSNKAMVGEVADTLASLPTGTGWLCSGEAKVFEKVAFPKIKTYDNGKTPDGEIEDLELATAPVDQDELRAIIGDAVKEAVANDPKSLKLEIARLNKLVGAAKAPGPAPAVAPGASRADLAAEYTRGREEGWQANAAANAKSAVITQEQIDALLAQAEAAAAALGRHEGRVEFAKEILVKVKELEALGIKDLALAINRLAGAIEKAVDAKPPKAANIKRQIGAQPRANGALPAAARTAPTYSPAIVPASGPAARHDGINGPQQRVLDAMAWWESVGIAQPTRVQVGVVASYSPGGGSFVNTLGGLRTLGLIDYPTSGAVCLTDAGRAAANSPGKPGTVEELHGRLQQILNGPQWRVISPLIEAYPEPLSREDIATKAGYEAGGGSFVNTLGSLRSLGVIDYPMSGQAVALPILFLEQRF